MICKDSQTNVQGHHFRAFSWLLFASTLYTQVLGQNPTRCTRHNGALPYLELFDHGLTLPRCSGHKLLRPLENSLISDCFPEGNVTINFISAETKPGFRLVGSQSGDKFSCYPLSDQDFWRSREAVRILRWNSIITPYTYTFFHFSCQQVPGDLRRLAHVISMAQQRLAVRVAVIGGSVTHGGACGSYALRQSTQQNTPGLCSWAFRFVEWLKEYHRNPNIKLFNLAVPATTSAWRLSHFDDAISVRPDLLIVDYGANEGSFFFKIRLHSYFHCFALRCRN